MTLTQVRQGREYHILDSNAQGKERARLDSLGLVPGAKIRVLSSSWAGFIVEIKGSRLALCKAVADTLLVA
ncbi:MAG: ferrous iron transport protein A [Actinobacteria bacterium]|nr:ferrous iron transport protein A [Actinomycetota bacterium]